MVVHWNPRRWGYSLIRPKRRMHPWTIVVESWVSSLEEGIIPLFSIWVSLHPNAVSRSGGLLLAWPTERWGPAWWGVPKPCHWRGSWETDVVRCFVWRMGSGNVWSGNLRGALKHWKVPHLREAKYLLHEVTENKIGTNKWKLQGSKWQSHVRDSCLRIRPVRK